MKFVTRPIHPLAQVPSHLAHESGRKEKSDRPTDVTFAPRFKKDIAKKPPPV